MRLATAALAACAVSLAASSISIAAVTFDWAYVGNAGNAAESRTGFGAVSYNYAIGKHEVTNAQYTAFLNAVAATDSFGGSDPTLYNANMGLSNLARGGISRSGVPGSYTYETLPNMANKPVNYVSFFDAMRFTNWLHNGQGSGGTESGAYTIGNGMDEVRSPDARYWVPSEDEWYKAAYHDASAGTAGVYFMYATSSNRVPIMATANSVGDISNPGPGVANFDYGARWNGQYGAVTTVGSAGIASASPYGTFDQTGNLREWNEAAIGPPYRAIRGGAWGDRSRYVHSSFRHNVHPLNEVNFLGFRVATIPEPTTATLLILGVMAVGMRRRC